MYFYKYIYSYIYIPGCIVYRDVHFETVQEKLQLTISHQTRDLQPSAVITYDGGNEETVRLNFLPFGKWITGVLKLGRKSEFIPNTTDDNPNASTDGQKMVKRSEVALEHLLVYTDCPTSKKYSLFGTVYCL